MFTITVDTSCDERKNVLKEMGIPYIPLTYIIDDKEYSDEFSTDEEFHNFYELIRKGAMPSTSQITEYAHEEFFEKVAKDNNATQIMHLGLSTGLSSTYENSVRAAQKVSAKLGIEVVSVNTVSASQGNAFVLDYAIELRNQGVPFNEACEKVEAFAHRVQHWIVVNDLYHLKRGGRVSGAAAAFGTMLNLKPILNINNEGKLFVVNKVMGMNKALQTVLQSIEKYAVQKPNFSARIASADNWADTEKLVQLIQAKYPQAQIKTGWIGPVIGAHTGPGVVAMVFETEKRIEK